MTTPQDNLPALPEAMSGIVATERMKDYARKAIQADRAAIAAQGEQHTDCIKNPEAAAVGATGTHACWCETCRPVTMTDCRMVLCPTCGNKRCPRANNHRNACTNSNEPGQPGSAYPEHDQAGKAIDVGSSA